MSKAETSKENGKKGGRPKGSKSKDTIARERAQEVYRSMVLAKLKPIIEAQLALALGHYKVQKMGRKLVRVYFADPDGGSIENLLNRAIGKPKDGLSDLGDGIANLGEAMRKILGGGK